MYIHNILSTIGESSIGVSMTSVFVSLFSVTVGFEAMVWSVSWNNVGTAPSFSSIFQKIRTCHIITLVAQYIGNTLAKYWLYWECLGNVLANISQCKANIGY